MDICIPLNIFAIGNKFGKVFIYPIEPNESFISLFDKLEFQHTNYDNDDINKKDDEEEEKNNNNNEKVDTSKSYNQRGEYLTYKKINKNNKTYNMNNNNNNNEDNDNNEDVIEDEDEELIRLPYEPIKPYVILQNPK